MSSIFSRKLLIWAGIQVICLLALMAICLGFRDQTNLLVIGAICWLLVSFAVSVLYLTKTLSHWRQIRNDLETTLQRRGLEPSQSFDDNDDCQFVEKGIEQLNLALKQGNRKLTQSVEHLNAVVDGMSDGIVAIDQNRNILLGNDACWQMLSLSQKDHVGRNLLEVCRIPELHELLADAFRSGELNHVEFETIIAPRRVILAHATQLRHRDAKGLTLVLRDVTEIRQLETVRRDFFTNVSHELKTPLASIKLYAETLRLGAINDQKKNVSFVEQIEIAADRLSAQIQDLLDLSRVESGKASLDLGPIDLHAACQSCVKRFESSAHASELEIQVVASSEPVIALADDEGVQTILDNLVSNAIRYTPAGGSVTLKSYNFDDNAILEVIDTGIGIPQDKLDRVFERFYRVDKARSREAGGTGIGLSIVKHMAQTLGGSVELESRIGKGSKFRICLNAEKLEPTK